MSATVPGILPLNRFLFRHCLLRQTRKGIILCEDGYNRRTGSISGNKSGGHTGLASRYLKTFFAQGFL